MRELRKETETTIIVLSNIFTCKIRNERTPKGDGNFMDYRAAKRVAKNKK